MYKYFVVHKPFNVLSQFTTQDGKNTLKDFFDVPVNVYPVGRLDYDSEGLLILTDDKFLNDYLLNPLHKHEREYWVQVEGNITSEAIDQLIKGVTININGKMYDTKQCFAERISQPAGINERNPPIRYRKNIPESWLRLILTEGKNRQVRKMTAKVGFPTLRLIRYRIEKITITDLLPGEMKILSHTELYNLLQIKKDNPYVKINDRLWQGGTNGK
ncbi:pseudouridine synthase [Ginsengibacter hankyongi]|uniref:pseudouridine synthase n=1 Tax=Ginsengibacter hankyongi TaxID=2607284 RepID=UPI0019262498|nr:pseudouridine synthase [Ginsengibacter hankyongi]